MRGQAAHRFLVLDGMRGAAAMMVLIGHATNGYARMSSAAVDLFFLLSGFVLAHAFGERLARGDRRIDFLLERLIRLYPLYLVGLGAGLLVTVFLIAVGIWWWPPEIFPQAAIAAPFFVPIAFEVTFPLNPPAWSLSFELVANLVFVMVGWRHGAAAALVVMVTPLLLWTVARWGEGGAAWQSLPCGFTRVFFSFFLGVLIYRLWLSGRVIGISVHPALLLGLVALLYLIDLRQEHRYFLFLVFVAHPLLIWIGANSSATGSWQTLLAWLGWTSYGVYVLHYPIVLIVELAIRAATFDLTASEHLHWFTVFIVAGLSLAASHWLTARLDVPVRAWLLRRLRTRRLQAG